MPHVKDHPDWDHEQQVMYDRGYADAMTKKARPMCTLWAPRSMEYMIEMARRLSGVDGGELLESACRALYNAYRDGFSEATRDLNGGRNM